MQTMIKVFFDGACAPINPGGTASYGWVIKKDDVVIASGKGVIGSGEGMTNNVGEYHGILNAAKALSKNGIAEKVYVFGDSSMVCNMVSKKWGWKKKKWDPHAKFPHLRKLLDEVFLLLEPYEYEIAWVPREQNSEADELSKLALSEIGIIDPLDKAKKCPSCGSKLIERKGPFGGFAGCSSYPKCKYTEKIDKPTL